ncbi:ArsS family sensor histidine kinase [Sulfurovum sp. NBC37-1]|uniref:ArsS family sensor histidine kinase n=1 Tax=Sulfurovum sp. (strain NBC37-1) TaxID=387093 RepID=UPI000158798C|nr:ArsS family sensor histidine kinase [Sulfurovum sp. NBC37-1]BAF72373.1 two-component sensor histidine kinase [Sulfurovum sp. NBC37-1]
MNRHSIFFKLNLFFAIAIIVTLIAGLLVALQLHRKERTSLLLKSKIVMQEYRQNSNISPELLKSLDLEPASEAVSDEIVQKKEHFLKQMKRHGQRMHLKKRVIIRGGEVYLLLKTPRKVLLFHSSHNRFQQYIFPFLIFLTIFILLSLIYWALRRSLLPLKKLEEDIRRYGKGERVEADAQIISGDDEVSRISEAFYSSTRQVQRLSDTRELFIKNLLHELNTPVTKGKLLAELSEEPRTKKMLGEIFNRLSQLLKELVKIEAISSATSVPEEKEKVSLRSILKEACERLFCKDITTENLPDLLLYTEKEAMIIVVKNLLDNAIKYGEDPNIAVQEESLVISSIGEALPYPLEHYTEPFRQEYGRGKKEGFGLGLYIVNEILVQCNMELHYIHKNDRNLFIISDLPLVSTSQA